MRASWDIVIVGAGIAGFSAASALSQKESAKSLLLLSDEDRIPYKRTKISKFIAEGFEKDQFKLQAGQWYKDHNIELLIGTRVTSIDPQSHTLTLADGRIFSWKKLILAPGASPVLPELFLPAVKKKRVHIVRTARHVESLLEALLSEESIMVAGMGVLGVELSEQLHKLGKRVSMIEKGPKIMADHLNERASEIMKKLFESRGIALHFNEHALSLSQEQDNLLNITLSGREMQADCTVFCIGARPNIELAKDAGLKVNRGIVVDQFLRTSCKDIFAAGDAAEHPGGRITHLWHAAEHQGWIAAENAFGGSVVRRNLPFRLKCEVFDHYFFSMNMPSQSAEYDCVETSTDRVYRCFYYHEDHLKGAVMINDKPRAKIYENAVREEWNRSQVAEHLSLPIPSG